ncbi:hypothetical protein ES703_72166 [subsurface metagenome]
MQRPARLDALSRAVRMSAVKPVVRQNAVRINAVKPVVLKKLRAAAPKKLRVAALQKPSPAARKRPVRLGLPSLVAAEKRALGPNRLLLLQAIIVR